MSGFYRLKPLHHGVNAAAGVLKAADLAQLQQAADVIGEAEAQAEDLRQQAQAGYEAEKQRGYREGRAAADLERAGQLLEDQRQLEGRLAELEKDLGSVVFECVRQIIQAFDRDDLAEEVARSALASMRSEQRAQLFVSSKAYPALRARLSQILTDFPDTQSVDLAEDPDLSPPNLRLVSSLGVVSFVLDDTLDALKRLLEKP